MIKKYPSWVLKHKKTNVEIRKINERYYAYKVKSIWDKEKKRAKKITEKYLGSITKSGLIPAKHNRNLIIKPIKEYGNIFLANKFAKGLLPFLKKIFPYNYESILSLAILKLCYNSTIKNYSLRYQTSYTSEYYSNAKISPNKVTKLISLLGNNTVSINNFFKLLSDNNDLIAIDLTTIFTHSKNISYAEIGYNSKKIYHEQLQFLMLYSIKNQVPTYFKVMPGSVRDVSSLVNAIEESEYSNIILVSDKGFTSEKNWDYLNNKKIKYVFPLRRNSTLLTYNPLDHKKYFMFRKRPIWYREILIKKKRIIQFLDKKLMVEEETTFLHLMEKEITTKEEYETKKNSFGIISILTNTNLEPEKIFELYKSRNDIEVSFGTMKNTLNDDKTYMQTTESVKGYFFITFLALYLHSKIQNMLKKKGMLSKYSVKDVLLLLSKIYKIKINNKEIISEIPKLTKTIIEKLKLPIP